MWQSIFQDLYQNLSSNAKDRSESIILGIHLYNISKGFQCTGLLEDDPVSQEILPPLWNTNTHIYSFRYILKPNINLYVKFVKLAETRLTVHAVRSDQDDKIRSFNIEMEEINKKCEEGKEITEVIINEIIPVYNREILNKINEEKKEEKKVDLRDYRGPKPYGVPYGGIPFSNPYNPFPGYLPQSGNPYGPGVPLIFPDPSGNVMGPNHPIFGQQPRPGVRWDPVNPFPDPEYPDHMRPPGGFPPHGFL
ncbi:unnamed protein product [Blepharisma stoltei]|uniref:PI31 proteasome regulator N-terminal domain-containing protein n=1 Tax=Blepharisma stoltei TaxID=1481888 RepID=A0AAU9JJT6_9CILI|nr:unnamed protein product [Blepharisma stoltei]